MPRPTSVLRAAAAVAAITTLWACGCNTVQNQTLNAEGVALYRQGAYAQAAEKFQSAIGKRPDEADAYYNLAASMHQTGVRFGRPGDLQQAEMLYNQCLERDGDHTDCHRGLAVLLNETSRPDAAFRLLNNWAMASPTNPNPRIELARLLEESERPQQATEQLVQALTNDPNNSRALAALGRLRDQSGDYAQALQNYQRSLAANPSQPQLAARVATLTSAAGGSLSGVTTQAGQTRMVNQWQAVGARY
ncbi:MAG: tetratricopeptide repeat protein [Planctomycetota bacterium]